MEGILADIEDNLFLVARETSRPLVIHFSYLWKLALNLTVLG
jgi:hypothetical protein